MFKATFATYLNRELGWGLIAVSFFLSAIIDPIYFGIREPLIQYGLLQVAIAQGAAVFVGLYQLFLGAIGRYPAAALQRTSGPYFFGLAGAMVGIGARGLYLVVPVFAWLQPLGSLLLFCSAFWLLVLCRSSPDRLLPTALAFISFGFLVDIAVTLTILSPELLDETLDDLTSRDQLMMRLGRAAAIAMPMLALMYHQLLRSVDESHCKRWAYAQKAMLFGGGFLAVSLVLTATLSPIFLVPVVLCAIILLLGCSAGAWLSIRHREPLLEQAGWTALSLSMTAGLVMGIFAFEIIPTPNIYGDYLSVPRQYIRTGHVYLNILSVVAIYTSRVLPVEGPERRRLTGGFCLFGLLTELLLFAQLYFNLSPWVLMIGPTGIGLVLAATAKYASRLEIH